MIDDVVSFDKKKFLYNGIGNTSDLSSHPEELYSERKKAIAFFEQTGEEVLFFYGKNWDPAKYKSYRGTVTDKIEVIKNFRLRALL